MKPQPSAKRIMIVGLDEAKAREIQAENPAGEFIFVGNQAVEVREKSRGIHALIGCPRNIFSDDLLQHIGPSLRWVHSGGAGVEEYMTPGFVRSDIVMTNGQILQGPEIADHAFGLLLAITRNIALVLNGAPAASIPRPIELRGKKALIIGAGGIGILIAERARAFGMGVYGLDADYVAMMGFWENCFLPEQLPEALALADVVFMAAPHTQISEKMMNAEAFGAMKKGAYFVNVSRGKTVCTESLVGALQSKHLAGAGLDVTEPEPLPLDHPLRKMPNVVITPHIAGLSEHNRQRSHVLMKQNITRFIKDLPLLNEVNKLLGY